MSQSSAGGRERPGQPGKGEVTSRAARAATRSRAGSRAQAVLCGLVIVALVACGGRSPDTDPLSPAPPDPDPPESAPPEPLEAWSTVVDDDGGVARIPVAAAAVGTGAVFVAYPGELMALDVDTGEPVWSLALPAAVSAAPVVAGELLAVALDAVAGDRRFPALWWVDVADGSVLENAPLVRPATALAPLVADVVFLDGQQLHRLGHPGRVEWSVDAPEVTAIRPDAAAATVYLSGPGRVDAVDAATGEQLWSEDLRRDEDGDQEIRLTRIALGDERIFVAGTHGRLEALGASDGDRIWRRDFGTDVLAAPAVTGDIVWVAPLDAGLHGFKAGNGTLLQRTELSARTYVDLTTLGPWAIVGPLYGPWVRVRPPVDEAGEQRPVRDTLATGSGLRLPPVAGPAGLALINGGDGTVTFMRLPGTDEDA